MAQKLLLCLITFVTLPHFSYSQGIISPYLIGYPIFPNDNAWHDDIRQYPVAANSNALIQSIGTQTGIHPDFGTVWENAPMGIPYILVGQSTPRRNIVYTAYGDESDTGSFPIPLNAPIEGGPQSNGDRHVIAVDTSNHLLYELYRAFPKSDHWEAESGVRWNLKSNALRKAGWTSADAAGLPIFAGLIRYDEVMAGRIDHAIRMTVSRSRRSYVFPATHQAGSTDSQDAPPMGQRFRLRADFDMKGFPKSTQVILTAMQVHGLIVADNGSNWFISGAPDLRWNDDELNTLKRVKGSDFEALASVDNLGKPIRSLAIQNRISYPGLRRGKQFLVPQRFIPVFNYSNQSNSTVTKRAPLHYFQSNGRLIWQRAHSSSNQ